MARLRAHVAPALAGSPYKYTNIAVPGAVYGTYPAAINAAGQIAGTYDNYAFVYSAGVYTTIDVPGASYTQPQAISDSGLVFGYYYATTISAGSIGIFQYNLNTGVLTASTITPQIPGITIQYAYATTIGPTGTVLGYAYGTQANGTYQYLYFLYSNGKTTVLSTSALTYFYPSGINAEGVVVGETYNSNSSSYLTYLYSNGTYTPFAVSFYAEEIGPSDQVLGYYTTNNFNTYQNASYSDGVVTLLGDDPSASPGTTYDAAVNASGQIVGYYSDASGTTYGFLATPLVAPATEKARANIDLPDANVQASGTYTAAGWAVDNTASINAVSIQVDGQFVGLATYGSSRADVCAVYTTSVGCPNVGWSYSLNTAALADGLHTFEAVAVSNNGKHAIASTSFTIANAAADAASAISMNIDTPNANTGNLSGKATLAGWAFDQAEAISAIAVTIDPVQNVLNSYYANYAVLGGARPDVCTAFANAANCANSGWTYSLDTTQLSSGAHTVAITAITASGNKRTLTASFNVSNNGPLRLNIDTPSAKSAAVSGSITIAGWAEDDNVAIGYVTYSVDGANVYSGSGVAGYAYLGGYRPDVCAVYPKSPDCPSVGWSALLDTTQLTNGTHTLTATAVSQSYLPTGASFYTYDSLTAAPVTFTVSNTITSISTHVNIDQPTASEALWHTVTISGWAVDDNTTIRSVDIAVDGQTVGSTTPYISRPDVCAVYPNRPSCPNVGWSTTLNTDLLTNGTHTLTVTAVSQVDAEATASTTINVSNGNGADTTKVNIDSPNAQSGNLSGKQTFAGWAINDDAATTITVYIDGAVAPPVTSGARADVCAVFPDAVNCPNVGWSLVVDTTLLANGAHNLQVVAASTAEPGRYGK